MSARAPHGAKPPPQTESAASAPAGPLPPDLAQAIYAKTLDCVHCGLCLTACPTYLATGRETSSPRGRVYLMRGAVEGRVPLAGLLEEEAFLCLGCRACETACPAGVEYGALLEQTRAALVREGAHAGLGSRVERALLRHVVARPRVLRAAVSLAGAAQRARLDRLASALLPASVGQRLALAPRVPAARARAPLPAHTPAVGERRGRVALFTGCIMGELFGEVHRATIRVLAHNGFDVVVPRAQRCCGALHAHAGDLDTARGLARANAEAFVGESGELDALIVNSAGCGAAMREAEHWIGAEGARYASRVRDVCEWLDEVGLRAPTAHLDGTCCYDAPCHLVHAQRVDAAPIRLLARVPGLVLLEHEGRDACCGAAGVYNLTHPGMSRQVLAPKLDALERADPDWIATGNPGCAMQIAAGARERGLRARVVHPVELLDAAYAAAAAGQGEAARGSGPAA
ncbi:MAG: (Fe-S)-binding protein [Myxococcota bacterium]